MSTNQPQATIHTLPDKDTIVYCQGAWTVSRVDTLETQLAAIVWPEVEGITFDGADIVAMDSVGAWILQKCINQLQALGKKVDLTGFSHAQDTLLEMVQAEADHIKLVETKPRLPNWFYRVGLEVHNKIRQVDGFLILLGEITINFTTALRQPKRLQLPSVTAMVEQTGYQALPIIALLLALIGIVLAYQMGTQLQSYGADVYIVYLSGTAILREFGPLITAIIVAGRTSSSFTAQIGLMKVNEEIDALRTMGLSPIERIVLPRILGLLIALPLLTFWADVFGVLGSMFMAKNMLGMGFYDFISRFRVDVDIDNYIIGLVKAPVFAVIIAFVGCYQGFQVASSAESVGRQTTRSVVQAIFLIIIADGIFSILFNWAGI